MMLWIQLLTALILILLAAQLFSNALEYFGQKLQISSGMTGSIFAAISTALPETTIPILAIISGTSDKLVNQEISVGAILGAPLMLATLSTFIMAISVIRKRSITGTINPERTGFIRDLNFFILAFLIAFVAMYVPAGVTSVRVGLGGILVMLYLIYLTQTFRASKHLVKDGHGVVPTEELYFTKLGMRTNFKTILIQLMMGLGLLLVGAKLFINSIHEASHWLGISPLLLSLLIVPIATELPEKVNSVIWIRKNKDTLAFGNITGAMVFQGTLLPAIGILMTPWQPNRIVMIGIVITLAASLWLRISIARNKLSILTLMMNGLLYFIYLGLVIY